MFALVRCSKIQDREEQKERFVVINGLAWLSHGKTTHDKHIDFATKTLIAYSPGLALEGTQYIHNMVKRGAKHSPPRDKFQISGDPPIAGDGPSEIHISKIKSYPNETCSIPTVMLCNVNSACVHPRF